jgi:hypothetical protein
MHVLGRKPTVVVLPDEDSQALELPYPFHRGARAFSELSFGEAHRASVLPLGRSRLGGSTATVGGTANITVSWNRLTAGTKYVGRVSYRDGVGEIGGTIVSVNP